MNLPSGYSRTLKAATVWQPVGSLSQGGVFKTGDQVLTIEGSNIYEAYIVVRGARLVGFYLPANGTYSPLSHPIDLNLLTPDGKTTVLTGES